LRLVVDANIIIASLIRDSLVRKMIINLPFEFYSPSFVFKEIEKHIKVISEKNSLSVKENQEVLARISRYLHVIDFRFYSRKIGESKRIIGHVDQKDIPYIALSLSFLNDGIWSEDAHFKKQKAIKIWRTKDLIKFL